MIYWCENCGSRQAFPFASPHLTVESNDALGMRCQPTCSQACYDALSAKTDPGPVPSVEASDKAYEAYEKGWNEGQDDARR